MIISATFQQYFSHITAVFQEHFSTVLEPMFRNIPSTQNNRFTHIWLSSSTKLDPNYIPWEKNSALFSRYSAAIVGRSNCRDAIVNFHAIGATNAISRYCAAKCE